MSCSSVMPMPPWSWTASRVMSRDASVRRALTALAMTGTSSRFSSIAASASSDDRLAQLELAEHVDRAVLQRLEGADQRVELHARLQVLDRGLVRLRNEPEHLGRDADRGAIEHRVEHVGALADLAEDRRCRDLDALQA